LPRLPRVTDLAQPTAGPAHPAEPIAPPAPLPALRREVFVTLALLCAGALLVAINGVALLLPLVGNLSQAAIWIFLLLVADITIFALIGRRLLRRKVLDPIDKLVSSAERIARGDTEARMPDLDTQELTQLASSVNQMAEKLIANQEVLEENIESLDETNRLLTEARDAMIHAEKMATVGRMAAGVAHEVGNPLGAIIGYLALLQKHVPDSGGDLLLSAEREARRIDRIIRGLLDFSRPHDAHAQNIDVNSVLAQTVELVATQGRLAGIDVALELEDDLPEVSADPYQLQQVLVNLLVNASDALDGTADPEIKLMSLSRKFRPPPPLKARRKDDPPGINYAHRRRLNAPTRANRDPGPPEGTVVEIVITDNGPGIPPDLLSQVFEPFVTTKEPGKGTGLGLAVSVRLVESMGGTLQVDSTVGEGATFRIVLPSPVETRVASA
jgi:two-component system NtrC family sensor kinase